MQVGRPTYNKVGGEAPVWQGARRERTGESVTDEQRRQAGCIAGRLPLSSYGCPGAPVPDEPT